MLNDVMAMFPKGAEIQATLRCKWYQKIHFKRPYNNNSGPKMLNNVDAFGNLKIIIRGPLFPFVGFSN